MNDGERFARQFGAVLLETGGAVAGFVLGKRRGHPYIGTFLGFALGGAAGWWLNRPVMLEESARLNADARTSLRAIYGSQGMPIAGSNFGRS